MKKLNKWFDELDFMTQILVVTMFYTLVGLALIIFTYKLIQ